MATMIWRGRQKELMEDLLFLRDTGEHPARAAARLGIKVTTLIAYVERNQISWPAATAEKEFYKKKLKGQKLAASR